MARQSARAHSRLQVPVPELESVVRPRLARQAPELLTDDPDEVTAHITLLSPFADRDDLDRGLVAELRSFFADVTPFAYEFREVSRFPGGATYLSPEPAGPFRRLAQQLHRRFPEYPSFGGDFDEIVPHVSIPVPDGEDPEKVRFVLEPRLPVHAYAREAVLFWWDPDGGRTLETFAFGTAAA
jgi:2'-5' RNA ligase